MTRYREIGEELARRVLAGDLVPGDELPGIRELGRQWSTTASTASRAQRALAEAGLIQLTGRRRALVAPDALFAPPQVNQIRTPATQQGAGEGCVVLAAAVQEVGRGGVRSTLDDRAQAGAAAVGGHRHHVPAESADHQVESGVVAPRQPQDDVAM